LFQREGGGKEKASIITYFLSNRFMRRFSRELCLHFCGNIYEGSCAFGWTIQPNIYMNFHLNKLGAQPNKTSSSQRKHRKMHIIMIVGDGMADRPLKQLDFQTPLEAAKPENMDTLAANGISGLLDPVAPGIAPGSDVANLSILGYNSKEICGGRGPFEAAGVGIELEEGDVAFRCNLATVDKELVLVDERAGRIRNGTTELAEALEKVRLRENPDVEVVFRQSLGFKGALVLRGERVSANVSATMPKIGDRVGSIEPLDDSFEAKRTARALEEFVRISYEALDKHPINRERRSKGKLPANIVIPWSGAKPPVIQPFPEKYKLKAACVAAASLIKGVAKLIGMSVIDVPGATGDLDTDTMAKAHAALKAVESNDFVLVHVEGPDEASHDGNVQGKISIIKKIDAMIGEILSHVDFDEVNVVLLADHTTSSTSRRHTGDPVPIAIASTGVVKDGVTRYNERAACRGGLRRICGKDVMPLMLNLMGNSQKLTGD
jgi:2,3-bisphosphoglycerate-independent phosphoglycerate mutase